MAKKASHKVAMLGGFLLVLLLLVLMLVPTIMANVEPPEDFIGIWKNSTTECYFADSDGFSKVENAEVFIVEKPGAPYGNDVVVLLRCQADLSYDPVNPPATNYSGSNWGECQIDFGDTRTVSTSWWSQTVSASGKATLTCQFKSNNGNG